MLIDLLLVALGGALGGIARLWVTGAVARRFGDAFPWGTLAVNGSGSAAIGIVAALLIAPQGHAVLYPTPWAALVVGVLGSYTTVSSFSLQTLALASAGARLRAALNVIASIGLCLSAAAAGYAAALWFTAGR